MTLCAAFLRGINVGGHTVTNERLKKLFEELGLAGVRPFLASGKVMFDTKSGTAGLEARVEAHLGERLGYAVPAFVRSAGQVAAMAGHAPFPDLPEGGKLHIGFLRAPPDEPTRHEIAGLASAGDRLAFHGTELYWHVTGRSRDSGLYSPDLDRALGAAWTVRTANTVRRIAARLGASPG